MNVGGAVTVTANTQTFMDANAFASEEGAMGNSQLPQILDQIIARGMEASGLGPAPLQFDPIAAVNGPTLTIPNHGLNTGDAVIYRNNEVDRDGDNVGGLLDGFAYFVHKLTNNTFTLHATFDNAVSGASPVNLGPASDADAMSLIKPAVPAAIEELISKSRLRTGNGAVGAAAANMDFSSALAGVAPGAVLNSGGAVNVHSIFESNPISFATGQNVNTVTGVGVAVAANILSQTNQASVGGTVTALAIDVGSSLGGGGVASPSAEAISALVACSSLR
jgi:hypothetical protein